MDVLGRVGKITAAHGLEIPNINVSEHRGKVRRVIPCENYLDSKGSRNGTEVSVSQQCR